MTGKNFERYQGGECLWAGVLSNVPCLGWVMRYKNRVNAKKSLGQEPSCLVNCIVTGICGTCSEIQIRREYSNKKYISFDKEEVWGKQNMNQSIARK